MSTDENSLRLSDALRAHAAEIEGSGWPTALSRDLKRAAEHIDWLEGEAPAHGEGPPQRSEGEGHNEIERRKEEIDSAAKASAIAALSKPRPMPF